MILKNRPWLHYESANGSPPDPAPYRVDAEGKPYDVIIGWFYEEEHARLFSAAPELLACVEGFVESWGKEVDNDEPITGSDAVEWLCGAMLEFRDALAKAKGAT